MTHAFPTRRSSDVPRSRWGASASDSGAGRFAQALDQRRLLLEAYARRIGQRDAPAFHPGVVGEAAEGREDLRIGLVAAELPAGGDVQRELMPAMRHHVAAGEAMVAAQGEGAQVFHPTVDRKSVV